MTETTPTVTFAITDNGIATVTMSRPQAANALNSQMALELKDIFYSLPENTRVVILTGAGERAFCAGADLKERHGMDVEAWQVQHQVFRHAIQSIMECPVPVIAAVNGAAYGGGLEIALTCDFIYASTNARFALPEVTLGIMPGMGGTQNLTRAVGMRRAKEMLFTGKAFDAEQAYAIGMINHIAPPETFRAAVAACAETIAANAPLSVKAAKRSAVKGMHLPIEQALISESDYYISLLKSDDRHEGINAYNEKRKPVFTGK